jgi:hypothetical protein
MELVMTLPILGIVIFALLEFSMLFFARGSVVEASRVGARMASLPGATEQSVEDEIRKVIQPKLQNNLQVNVQLGENTGDVVSVIVMVASTEASPDLLWPIGYSLKGKQLIAETRMIRE